MLTDHCVHNFCSGRYIKNILLLKSYIKIILSLNNEYTLFTILTRVLKLEVNFHIGCPVVKFSVQII